MTYANQKKNHYKALAFTALLCATSIAQASHTLGIADLEIGVEYLIKNRQQQSFLIVSDEWKGGCRMVVSDTNKRNQQDIGNAGIFILEEAPNGSCYIKNKEYEEYLFAADNDKIGVDRYIETTEYTPYKCRFHIMQQETGYRLHNAKHDEFVYLASELKASNLNVTLATDGVGEKGIFEFIRYQNNTIPTPVSPDDKDKPKPGFIKKWIKSK